MHNVIRLCFWLGACCYTSTVAAQQLVNPFESIDNRAGQANGASTEDAVATPTIGSQIQAQAQAQTPPASDSSTITIGAVNVNGGLQVPATLLASAYERFIGLEANEENLRALAGAVSKAARDEGYIFASAQVPPQSVKIGVVSVQLDPGPIDEVRIVGSQNESLRNILSKLQCKAAVSGIIERQLLLAGDLPGITIEGSTYERENGRGVLVVNVNEDRTRAYASLDNYGPDTLGPIRARIEYDVTGLLSDGDVLTTNAISTVFQPKELTYVNIRYAATLDEGSTVVGFSGAAGRTFSGGSLSDLNYRGRTRYASVFASHAIKRSNDFNLWLNAELAYLEVLQSGNGNAFQDDRIVTASLDFSGNYKIGIGQIYGGIGVTQGLGVLGASVAGDPLNSRANGSGIFTKANFWVNSILDLGDDFGMRLAANAQIASRPLLSANEIALGGPYFGRGYDFSERYGDEGVIGLVELRKGFNNVTDWLDWLQLYGFVDGGYITNIGDGYGDGSLASAGGGMRAQIGKFDLGLEAAAPITDDRFESSDRSPKVNMQVGVRF